MKAERPINAARVAVSLSATAAVADTAPVGKSQAPMGRKRFEWDCFALGLLLLSAFWVQHMLGWKWQWLSVMQTVETYKQVTGLILIAYLADQWRLSLLRMRGQMPKALSRLPRHKVMGALAPLFFYFHAHQPGYAYLLVLTGVYFANCVVGLFNCQVTGIRSRHYQNAWLICHVSLSVLLLVLAGYHVYIAFTYN